MSVIAGEEEIESIELLGSLFFSYIIENKQNFIYDNKLIYKS